MGKLKSIFSIIIFGAILFFILSSPLKSLGSGNSALDTYTRSVSGGWGTADTGGSYTTTGTAANFSVNGSQGVMNVTGNGSANQMTARLDSVSAESIDATVKISIDKISTGSAHVIYIIGRHISTGNEYRMRIRIDNAGQVYLQASTIVSSVETLLSTEATVTGLTITANQAFDVHYQLSGVSPTTINARAWLDGNSEPGTWNFTTTDSAAILQAFGSVGLLSRAGASAPINFSYDNFTVNNSDPTPTPTATPTNTPTPTPTPTPGPSNSVSGTIYNDLNDNGVQDLGETGHQGATVTLSGAGSATTTTDSSGNYSFTNLSAGTYTVTLAPPSGYQLTTSNPVSVAVSNATTVNFGINTAAAYDTYTRVISNGWGSADVGGAYTTIGAASDFSVDGSQGIMLMTATGSANQRVARLDSVSVLDGNYTLQASYSALPNNSNSNYTYMTVRRISTGNEYRGKIRLDSNGHVFLQISTILSGVETFLGTEAQVAGLTYIPKTWLDIHIQLVGSSPTTINMRAWNDISTEPSTWTYSISNNAAVLQAKGGIGIVTRLGIVTNTPITVSYDNFVTQSSDVVPTPTATPTPTAGPTATPTPTPAIQSFPGQVTTVFTILMENQDWSSIKGSTTSAPFINSLITGVNPDNSINAYHKDVAYTTNYKSVLPAETGSGYLHPSEPNYIWLEAGTNQFSDTTFNADNTPSAQSTTSNAHLVTLLNNAGKSWHAYQENISAACPINNGTNFVPRHSPFVYFQDVSAAGAPGSVGTPSSSSAYCSSHEFDYSQLATDLTNSTVANYNFITPNLCDDMHNSCAPTNNTIKQGDSWLQSNLPSIINSPVYQTGHAIILVVWDEDSGSTTNNPVGMMAISPQTKGNGYASSLAFSHSSYLKSMQEIFQVGPLLGNAASSNTKDLSDLFGDPIVAAAGDIACGVGSGGATCQQQETANVISGISPSVVLPLGDNQYEQGALSDFQNFYNPTWGQFKSITEPSVGNHEYLTTSAQGYFDYFNGVGNQTGQAGDRSKGYYSYNVGNWHLIALNTNCSSAGGCSTGSPQDTWLKADLAGASNKCVMAYDHHPMFSSGQQPHNSGVDTLFTDLYNAHADVFLVGHDHDYERFYPSSPNGLVDNTNGVTEFVVGTGGRNHTQLSSSGLLNNSAVFDATTFGVLKMTLHNSSYDWQFIPSASGGGYTNGSFVDSGTANCHWPNASNNITPTSTPIPTPSQTYTLNGNVYNDLNDNGTQDSGELGQQSVTVTLTGGSNPSTPTTTDASGNYSFSNLASGTYSVSVALPTNFQSTTTNPQTIPVNANTTLNFGILNGVSSFQPTPPLYGTFFYDWYKNPNTDGASQWGIWADPDALGPHNPASNWFSNYLPQPTPNVFNPTTDLYSSNDYNIFKWQLTQLAQAKQEVAIASWWGQGDRSDIAFSHQITDFMNRSDNPYPNLRWATYYECEGNTCNGTFNPSVATIVSDLNYIATNYVTQPSYLKIGGKPVIFVYADPTDGGTTDTSCSDNSMTARWQEANKQAISKFYVVLKVFNGYATDVCQPDSWHQYGPASRTNQQDTYSYMVSPGFWRSGDTVRLPRDLNAFTTAVQSMVAANATWKLTETWNEWGEGSAVEPGMQVIQATSSGTTIQDPNGTTFQNSYVNILSTYLPPLPSGTGVTTTPTPTPANPNLTGTVYVDTNINGVQDGGETGHQGVTVTLSGASSATTTTDASGNYAFNNLNAGTYTVTITSPSNYQLTTNNPASVSINSNTTVNFGIALISLSPTPTPAPINISGISITLSDTTANISWTTNIIADSEISYGASTLYDNQVATDVNGVTSHTIVISNLIPCTTYYVKLRSLDDLGNSTNSTDQKFTTTGCPGNSTVLSEVGALIPSNSGGILQDAESLVNTDGIALTIPGNYSLPSAIFQIHELDHGTVLPALSAPSSYHPIENYTYQLEALPTVSTTLSSFNSPVTITISYSAADVAGIDPGTIALAYYHQGAWEIVQGCTINTTLRQVTCPTSSFSLFTLVSVQNTNQSSNNSSGSSSSGPATCAVNNPPSSAPNLYQADVTDTTATLYFAPANSPYTSYFVSYGPGLKDESYGVQFNQGFSSGAIFYKINALSPSSEYTFKVRANNNCAIGPWSKDLIIKTGPKNSTRKVTYFPALSLASVYAPTPALYSYSNKTNVAKSPVINPPAVSNVPTNSNTPVSQPINTPQNYYPPAQQTTTQLPKTPTTQHQSIISAIEGFFSGLLHLFKK